METLVRNNIILSIVVPYHNEPYDKYENLFLSLRSQYNIDYDSIEIIISNNCDEPVDPCLDILREVYKNVFLVYPDKKNSLSYSRQYATNLCHGDFVLYCDCDDFIDSNSAFYYIFNYLKSVDGSSISVICPYNMREIKNATPPTDMQELNFVEVWGKLYNRKFMIKYNIKFDDKIFFNEDREFNAHILNESYINNYSIVPLPICLYFYKDSESSTEKTTLFDIKVRDLVLYTYKALKDYPAFCNADNNKNYILIFLFYSILSVKNEKSLSLFMHALIDLCRKFDSNLDFLRFALNINQISAELYSYFIGLYNNNLFINDFNFEGFYGYNFSEEN